MRKKVACVGPAFIGSILVMASACATGDSGTGDEATGKTTEALTSAPSPLDILSKPGRRFRARPIIKKSAVATDPRAVSGDYAVEVDDSDTAPSRREVRDVPIEDTLRGTTRIGDVEYTEEV